MRNMKDSGIEWIGEIPKDWEVIRLKIICDLENGFSFKSCDYIEESNTLCCRMSNIRPNGVFDISYSKIYLPDSYVSKYKSYLLKDKDIIIAMTDMANAPKILGVPTEVKTDGYNLLLNQRVGKLIIKNNSINTLFLKYSMSSESSKYYFTLLSDKNIQINLSKENLLNMFITYPSLEEQELIANYLDSKVSEIDNIISKTKETIEEYKKYKQFVITEAVTKGVNPNVEMKDSGIEWIREIPKDWTINRIKNYFKVISGATPKSDNDKYWNGNITWVTPADYKTEDVYIRNSKRNISTYGLDSCSTTIVPKDSIIISSRAPIGLVGIADIDLCTNQGCKSLVNISNRYICNKFVYYYMSVMTEVLNIYGKGTTFLELSSFDLNNFKITIPTIDEQEKITLYLDKKCNEINNLICKKENLITELEQYKKSLIYECVTGKKEVSVSYAD